MPFKSEKQRRLCWRKYNKAKKKGRKPKWDCKEWERAGNKSRMSFRGSKICGVKTQSGRKCRRKCLTKHCWQHS